MYFCMFDLFIKYEQNWTVHGLYWGSYMMYRPQVLEESLNQLLSWLSSGLIRVHISHIYSPPEVSNP